MRERERRKKENTPGRRARFVIAAVLAWLLLAASLTLLIDGRGVCFYMYGDEELTLEYGADFTDPGVYAVTSGRLFGEGRRRLALETLGSVDPHKLGTYVLRYRTRTLFSEYSTERRVTVVDTTAPVIELEHIAGYEPTWLTGYAEEGYRAYDACDGDLTGKVLRTPLEDRIVYTVSDRSGNQSSVERLLPQINYQPPSITLFGEEELQIEARTWFEDPGYEAWDSLGENMSELVVTEGLVIPWLAGEYQLRYSITSESGEEVSALRRVTVLPVPIPEPVIPPEKTIYLTFDDGPGPYTSQLLDVLDAYGVKATFFVTAANPRYFDQIGRASRAGHSIGVHTSTHNYNSIYASEQAFFDDFFNMEEIIYQQTGSYTRLFRFPGGSSNTVSSFNPGIMSRLTRAMTDMGYQYYDWNVSSGDAGETNKTNKIIANIKDGCSMYKTSVVLQHDIKDYSVAAVETVIQWGLANGYSFRALQLDSPTAHHGVNN